MFSIIFAYPVVFHPFKNELLNLPSDSNQQQTCNYWFYSLTSVCFYFSLFSVFFFFPVSVTSLTPPNFPSRMHSSLNGMFSVSRAPPPFPSTYSSPGYLSPFCGKRKFTNKSCNRSFRICFGTLIKIAPPNGYWFSLCVCANDRQELGRQTERRK